MTVTLLERQVSQQAVLALDREDIRFWNTGSDRVRIEVTVHNRRDARSSRTPLAIRSAPLGAFVPWQPLTSLEVPPLDPGGQVRLHTEVDRVSAEPLGAPSRVSPTDLTDAAIGGRFIVGTPSPEVLLEALAVGIQRRRSRWTRGAAGRLAPDVLELLGRSKLHWAGNLNVFVGNTSVERHLAQALRIYPGHANFALFYVGSEEDSYSFEIRGSLAEHAVLRRATCGRSVLDIALAGAAIQQGEWHNVHGPEVFGLAMSLPEKCQEGNVEVHVRQRSTDKVAVVEFRMDARAAGTGCYTV